jgi:hypothetical protein
VKVENRDISLELKELEPFKVHVTIAVSIFRRYWLE